MDQSDFYKFYDGVTQLDANNFNARFLDVNSRLGSLEAGKQALNDAIDSLVSLGTEQISNALLPAFQTLTEIQTLGFLSAPIQGGTNAVFATGNTTVVIAATQKALFIPSPWVALVRTANATDYCIAQVLSYTPATGALVLNITTQAGNAGTYTDVTVSSVAGGAIAAIDAYAGISSAVTTVNAALATITADLAIVIADTAIVQGAALSAGVVSINGTLTGAVTGIEVTSHKAAANGYAGLDANAHVPNAQLPVGLGNGICGLDGSAKTPINNLPASILNCDQYQGTWNAASNSPSLVSSTGTKGWFYKVSAAGSTVLDGQSVWNVGDIVWFDGLLWNKFNAGFNPANFWTTAVISAAPATYRAALGAEPAATANGLVTDTTVNRTLLIGDAGQLIERSFATACTVTIPPNSSVNFPYGNPPTRIDFIQTGAGQLSFVAGASVTILSLNGNLKVAGQYAGASLYQRAQNIWVLFGALSA